MRTIAELLNQHAGEEAWLFGKGPSLDEFDMQTAGKLRISINESALVVPNAMYFFAHDEPPIERVANRWPSDCRAVLQPVRARFAQAAGVPDDAIFTYEKRERDWTVLEYGRRTRSRANAACWG